MSMNIDTKIQTLRALCAETESKDQQTWAIVRGTLGEIEEELQTLRAEKARREIEYFTRAEFCERLKISEKPLREAERARTIRPAVRMGRNTARYSSLQLQFVGEILDGKRNPDGSLKRQDAVGRRQTAGKTELREVA